MSLQYYQHYMLPEPESGVMACFAQDLYKEQVPEMPSWAASFPNLRRLSPQELPAGYKDGWGMDTVVINSDVALHYLVRKAQSFYTNCVLQMQLTVFCSSVTNTRAPL